MMKRLVCLGMVLLFAAMLAACGGGDDEQQSTTAETSALPIISGEPVVGKLGSQVDLGDLVAPNGTPPPGDGWYYTKAVAINDNGVVVGQSNPGNNFHRDAFQWTSAGKMRSLGPYPPGGIMECNTATGLTYPLMYSEAIALNNSNNIIGNRTTGAGWPNEGILDKQAFAIIGGDFVNLHVLIPNLSINGIEYEFLPYSSEASDISESNTILFSAIGYPVDNVCKKIQLAFFYKEGAIASLIKLHNFGDEKSGKISEGNFAYFNGESFPVYVDLNLGLHERINHLPGKEKTVAVDINDSIYFNNDGKRDAHIIGNSGNENLVIGEDETVQGFFWDGGAMYPIGFVEGGSSVVADLNNLDQVVGSAIKGSAVVPLAFTPVDGTSSSPPPAAPGDEVPAIRAFLWTLDQTNKGVMTDLGTLGGKNSWALAINETGQVVGYSETGEYYKEQGLAPVPVVRAFLWEQGTMYDLGSHKPPYNYPFVPHFPFSQAVAINASGQVAGNSMTINNHFRGYYLAPVRP